MGWAGPPPMVTLVLNGDPNVASPLVPPRPARTGPHVQRDHRHAAGHGMAVRPAGGDRTRGSRRNSASCPPARVRGHANRAAPPVSRHAVAEMSASDGPASLSGWGRAVDRCDGQRCRLRNPRPQRQARRRRFEPRPSAYPALGPLPGVFRCGPPSGGVRRRSRTGWPPRSRRGAVWRSSCPDGRLVADYTPTTRGTARFGPGQTGPNGPPQRLSLIRRHAPIELIGLRVSR
jgi:hypothetical protein